MTSSRPATTRRCDVGATATAETDVLPVATSEPDRGHERGTDPFYLGVGHEWVHG